jgi:hypothetical protein
MPAATSLLTFPEAFSERGYSRQAFVLESLVDIGSACWARTSDPLINRKLVPSVSA